MMPPCHCEIRELPLRDPFGLSRGTRRVARNLFIRVGEGWGEGAPIYYLGQNVERMAEAAREWLAGEPDFQRPVDETIAGLLERYPGETALAQAVDLAWHDAWGRRAGMPLGRLWNAPSRDDLVSSFTIGMDSLETVLRKVDRAEPYPILKIKVGGEEDYPILRAIHERTRKPLYVDANEGWTMEQTVEMLPRLKEMGVRLVEQPLPRADRDGYRRIREANRTEIPVIVDEGVHGPEDVEAWAGLADGINIKLAKCGGLDRARRMIHLARRQGLRIMLGCMIESSLGITAAAHLAPWVDYLDLDGAALLAEDPFRGMVLDHGRLVMPGRPGIGATPAE
ncbi:MAG TPA: dipeptide epimerase [bacterium]|nr:dipeptide epimerase [bacterium]